MPPKREHPLSPEKFEEIFSQVPRLTVDLIVRYRGGVILTKRALQSWHGKWHLPGGGVRYQESVADAARRIAREELGIEIAPGKVLGYIEYDGTKERGFGQDVALALVCDYAAGELYEKTDEASEIRAFTELPENMIPEPEEFLREHWSEIAA